MPLTTIKGSNVGAVLTNTQLNTTGTGTSSTVLPGTFAWSSASRSGLTNYAASDPASPNDGDTWYTGGATKVALGGDANEFNIQGAWASATPYPIACRDATGFGIPSASVFVGGYTSPSRIATTYEYNSVIFTLSNNLPAISRMGSSFGSQSAGVQVGGENATDTATGLTSYEYDGTSWAAAGSFTGGTGRWSNNACGILSAGLMWGGSKSATVYTDAQEYDGTSWSAGTGVGSTTTDGAGYGTQSSAISASGGYRTTSFEWNNVAWSSGGTVLLARSDCCGSGSGITSGIMMGGWISSPNGATGNCEVYNGTAWASTGSLTQAKDGLTSAGSGSTAVSPGGQDPSGGELTTNEEYSQTQLQYYDV